MQRFIPNGWVFLVLFLGASSLRAQPHDYMVDLYDRLHGSPKQEHFRTIAPIPVGVVYIQRPGEGEAEIREHFRTMKRLGFTALKQIQLVPGWEFEDVALIALDEGIIPWWYGEGGWEPITVELLRKLGLPADMPLKQARDHPAMIAYQMEVLKNRVRKLQELKRQGKTLDVQSAVPESGGVGPDIPQETRPAFFNWLKEKYGSIDQLNHAYSFHHYGIPPGNKAFESWEDAARRWDQIESREYHHIRDQLRFKADMRIERVRERALTNAAFDPDEPVRAGGEMGMFLPFSYRGVDMEGIAEVMTDYGSFYPSIHLAWHFDEVEHEITRPIYMMAALTHDYFKGGWSATWESTGGPQQFSGGKGGYGFTVDDGIMTQFMLSYLAAGYRGFGFWAWSVRTAGWEGGEYGMLDRNNEVTDRAVKVGKIGQAARKYRDELWEADKEPLVGVYTDWDNEAYWAAMSIRGRDVFRQWPIEARAGVSRALINADVPYEYVTATDILDGLAPRYPIIYMPFALALSDSVLNKLAAYVEQGGRLVMDMPSAYYDENGALLSTKRGSVFEKIFGAVIRDYQYAGVNVPYRLGNLDLHGFTLDLQPTSAGVAATYDNGKPAVTENRLGRGTAVILGYEASRMAYPPGKDEAEAALLDFALGSHVSPFGSAEAIVYRLAALGADHYFLINDGPATRAHLDTGGYRYKGVTDAVTGETLKIGEAIPIDGYDGRWLRFEK